MPRFLLREKVHIPERMRKHEMDEKKLEELKQSIKERGLYHPPMFINRNDRLELVAGERRVRAMFSLLDDGETILHDTWECPKGSIPITLLAKEASPLDIARAEFEENMLHEPFHWSDVDRALALLHKLEQEHNPRQTIRDTAINFLASGRSAGKDTQPTTLARRISQANIVAQHLDDPEVAAARNSTDAYNIILRRSERDARTRLRAASAAAASVAPPDLRLGDAMAIMPTLPEKAYDLILTDPPYGISAHSAGFRSRSEHKHEYDDTLKNARALLPEFLLEAFRLAKTRANLFLFCDIQNWDLLQAAASRIGWVPWRTALIWSKSQNEGMAPWGGQGPLRTHEVIFFATKGEKGLFYSIPDILYAKRVRRSRKVFAAQKPHELLRQLIACSTIEGDTIFDPFAGSGSTLRSARLMSRAASGIELNPETHAAAMDFIQQESEEEELDDGPTAEQL